MVSRPVDACELQFSPALCGANGLMHKTCHYAHVDRVRVVYIAHPEYLSRGQRAGACVP